MARNKLTDSQVRAATAKGKIGDGDGLWLLVSASGNKSWCFIFARNGIRREMGLGAFDGRTEHVSLAQARLKADEIRDILGRGGDPFIDMVERRVDPVRKTFADVTKDFLTSNEPGWRNEKHRAQWKMTLGDAYCSRITKRFVDEIDTGDIVSILEPIWRAKPETASRLRGRIERILDFARVQNLRAGENPARWRGHLQHRLQAPQKLVRGHHAALPYQVVPAFLGRLRAISGVGAMALEFLILTAARSGEVMGATWAEFDLDGAVWTVPADRMKAGQEHRVPLSDQALTVVRLMREQSRNEFVFPGAKQGRPIANTTMAVAIEATGTKGATPHGFRSSFRDWAGDRTAFPREIAEAALAHRVGNATELAYRRKDALEKRRKLMAAWANYLDSHVGTAGANIVPLRA